MGIQSSDRELGPDSQVFLTVNQSICQLAVSTNVVGKIQTARVQGAAIRSFWETCIISTQRDGELNLTTNYIC